MGLPAAIGLRLIMIAERYALPLQERWYDARRGISTGGQEQLEHGGLTTQYQAVHPHAMRTFLRHVPGDRSEQTFVDYGSGRGRGVFLACEAGFGTVIGVELEDTHHALAVANLAAYARKHPAVADRVTLACADAVQFELPAGPLVLFVYNPFGGEILADVLASTVSQLRGDPRPTWLIYAQPVAREVIDTHPSFRLLAERDVVRGATPRRARYAVYEVVLDRG